MRRYLALGGAFVAAMLAVSAQAKTGVASASAPKTAPVSVPSEASNKDISLRALEGEARTAMIAGIEQYLSGISTMTAGFSQRSSDASTGEGKFYLKRPGKMRWQYAPPTPIQLVSDGKVVVYYDPSLDQVSYVGIDETLAGLLTKKDLKLTSESTALTALAEGEGIVRATVIRSAKPSEGNLTLEFSKQPLALQRLISVDATGNVTEVRLSDVRLNMPLEDKLFVFVDPRSVNQRRNRR